MSARALLAGRGPGGAGLALWVITALLVLMPPPAPASAATCPNEAIRAEQGAAALALPECRAYELVSSGSTPLVGRSGEVAVGVRASDSGAAIAYFSPYPFSGSTSSGMYFRAMRGPAGWSLEAMSPQLLPGPSLSLTCEPALDYSEDLSASVLTIGREIKQEQPESPPCGQPQNELVPGEPRGFTNLLLRRTPSAPLELVNVTPAPTSPANAQFQDGSSDLSHIVFGEEAQLTPEAPPGYDLYEWFESALRLVTFLPDGSPVRGDLGGATRHANPPLVPGGERVLEGGTLHGTAGMTNAVSSNGERVFFYANGNLYMRENAAQPPTTSGECDEEEPKRGCTVELDASRGLGKSGGGIFQYASADGSRVFFTAESKLSFPSSAEPGKPELYEYDVAEEELTDLTPGATEGANVRGFSGASADGSRVYFVALGALTGGQQNEQGDVAQAKQPNLYLAQEGTLTFIATLDPSSDRLAWNYELTPQPSGAPTGESGNLATRTSPDGRYFAFNSVRGLTGGPTGTAQIFLFDAETGTLSCASCLPGGGAPPGPSQIPVPVSGTQAESPAYMPRSLTDHGQLFFTTNQALLPGDSDGLADVYEYREGELRLISDGTGAAPSFFFDASEGGGDVFFGTADPLVRADTDNVLNLYDARVGGGFAEPPAPAPPCSAGDSCRGPGPGAPSNGAPATPGQTGAGNAVPPKLCKRGKVRRHGRCVKKKGKPKTKHKGKPKKGGKPRNGGKGK